MKHFVCAVSICLCMSALQCLAADKAMTWTNPLVPQRADPQVSLQADGKYYLAATVPAYDCIELRRAGTIADLSTAKPEVVWSRHKTGPMSGYIWAPELHRMDGKWYIYFAAGEAPSMWNIHMYVLENPAADPFTGEWVEKGMIRMNWDSFTLDATTFEFKGTRYLVWAQSVTGQKGTNIYIAKMDTPWSIQGKQIVLSKPELDWERRGGVQVNEGPAVLIRNGRVFITYSASAADANYCLGLLTADGNANLLDLKSWSKSPEPVFVSSPENGLFGPGHNSFTTTPDGKQDIIFYHARTYAKIHGDPLKNPDRGTRAQYVGWKPDGMPDFGPPQKDGLIQPPTSP